MKLELRQIDAFCDGPFSGNPAAFFQLEAWPGDAWLQAVAQQLNLSETAFVVRSGPAYELRWFTPEVEVELCGHATLASAAALFGTAEPAVTDLEFQTRYRGRLSARREGEGIEIDLPADLPAESEAPPELLTALGLESVVAISKGKYDYLVEVESERVVRDLTPDFVRLSTLSLVRGVIVTARGDDYDFVSRFFAPGVGVAEDPVTGSAHCLLAPYWRARLDPGPHRAYQASSRGGVLRVTAEDDRVRLWGRARTVWTGEWQGPPPE